MLQSQRSGSESNTSSSGTSSSGTSRGGTTSLRAATLQRLVAALPDRYEFLGEIGSGGAAHVFLVHDNERKQNVAIKVLRPEVTTAIGRKRFLREIEIIHQLQHPNVLPMLDSGTVAGQVFFTTPYVEGDTLEMKIRREHRLTLADAVSIASDVAAALDYAHSRGLIHRDIKPANILLSGNHAVVADFGIARAVAVKRDDAITISGVSLGTAQYMSPEQCSALRELDQRTDVYAFGCVVYEMLTGDPPFTGASEQIILARHCAEAPQSMRTVRPDLPRRVDGVVMKSLAKVRSHRYRSAGEFFDALDAASRS